MLAVCKISYTSYQAITDKSQAHDIFAKIAYNNFDTRTKYNTLLLGVNACNFLPHMPVMRGHRLLLHLFEEEIRTETVCELLLSNSPLRALHLSLKKALVKKSQTCLCTGIAKIIQAYQMHDNMPKHSLSL